MTELDVAAFGDFNNKNVFGFFRQTLESSFPTTTKFGMRIDALVPNATLLDEDGNLWNVVRYHNHSASLGILLRTNADGAKLYEPTPDVSRAYAGPITNYIGGDAHIAESTTTIPGKQLFKYTRWVDRMEWSEGDLLQLTGVEAAPGICWYSPNADGGWMFTSYITRVSGTVMGRRCEGFSEYATCWTAPGVSWPAMYIERGMVWLIVCNEYTDGTRDLCHIGFNSGDCQFAFMATEDGPRMVTRDIGMDIVLDEGRYPKELRYVIGGERWQWVGAEHGHLGHPKIGVERGREGIARREGDTREIKVAYGWVNFFSDDRIDPWVIEA